MSAVKQPTIRDAAGTQTEVSLDLAMYKEAFENHLTLPQYLAQRFPTDEEKYGTPFEQLLASSGMFLRRDPATGIKPPNMYQVLNGDVGVSMGPVVRPDGTQALTVAGRFLFPAVLMQMIEHQLSDDNAAYVGMFNRLVAVTESVSSPRADQPIINLTAPRGVRSQPIAQMAEPPSMVKISLSDKSYRIPTFSIGFEISDEAAKASAVDLVGISLREQAVAERAARVDEAIVSMISGDTDLGISALSSENASSYDSAATSAAAFTNKAWIKWLRKDWKKLTIDWVICDLDTYLAIENRVGRPTIQTDAGNDTRLTSLPQLSLTGIPGSVNFFPVETAVIGANTLVGIDSSKAIRKVMYSGGQYSAVEQFVMRKSTAMRFDWAEAYYRLFYNGDGFKKLVLA